MALVYPRQTMTVAWSAGKSVLNKNEPWDDQAELVKERPDLFDVEPARAAGAVPRVERATRAPGERRGPRKSGRD